MTYGTSAQSYLARAKTALLEGSAPQLFYAAYELRCCIEARQAEYVEALVAYDGTKIRPWKLREQGGRIRKHSHAASIVLMRMTFPDGTTYDSYHTPITDELLEFAEQTLGPLLHSQPRFREADDLWWQEQQEKLKWGYKMAWLACQGDSMVPPLWKEQGKSFQPSRIVVREDNKHIVDLIMSGQRLQMHISYPDEPPVEWECDI